MRSPPPGRCPGRDFSGTDRCDRTRRTAWAAPPRARRGRRRPRTGGSAARPAPPRWSPGPAPPSGILRCCPEDSSGCCGNRWGPPRYTRPAGCPGTGRAARGPRTPPQRPLFGRICNAVEQPLDIGADGGQRRAHVVGDAGQQLLPALLLALELLHGGAQPVGHLVERLADRLEFVPLRVRDPMAEVAVPDLADALGQGRQGLGDVPERDRAMMPAARLMLVSSTSPLGSMPNSPADVATTASCTGSPRRNSASRNSRTPRNGIQ